MLYCSGSTCLQNYNILKCSGHKLCNWLYNPAKFIAICSSICASPKKHVDICRWWILFRSTLVVCVIYSVTPCNASSGVLLLADSRLTCPGVIIMDIVTKYRLYHTLKASTLPVKTGCQADSCWSNLAIFIVAQRLNQGDNYNIHRFWIKISI